MFCLFVCFFYTKDPPSFVHVVNSLALKKTKNKKQKKTKMKYLAEKEQEKTPLLF